MSEGERERESEREREGKSEEPKQALTILSDDQEKRPNGIKAASESREIQPQWSEMSISQY